MVVSVEFSFSFSPSIVYLKVADKPATCLRFSFSRLDKAETREYTEQNYFGGATMLNRMDRSYAVTVIQSVPAMYWQNTGLTLSYPCQGK